MRLGDLDALLDKFLRSYTEQEKVGNFQFVACEIKQGFADMVCEQPTIDAVSVVRCRHCQSHHWEQEPCHGKTVHYCEKLKAEEWPDFFCGYGERKEAEGDV